MTMASSLWSLNLCPPSTHSSSPSIYFLFPHPKSHYSSPSITLKFKLSCSHNQTIQLDNTPQTNPTTTKKKRKPRPSFLDQIHDKWSLKTTPLTQKFPWEEQERPPIQVDEEEQRLQVSGVVVSESENDKKSLVSDSVSFGPGNRVLLAPRGHGNKSKKTQFDFYARNSEPVRGDEEEQSLKFSGVVGSESETDKNSPVSDSVSFGSGRRLILAPWAHGNKPKKTQLNSEPRKLENNVLNSVIEESKNLEREVSYNVKCDEKAAEFDARPIGLSDKNQILFIATDKSVSFNKNSSAVDNKFINFESSSDEKGSMTLPWEKKSVEECMEGERLKKSNNNFAERLVPESELKRLRNVSLRMVERIKVGPAGITQALVDSIHEKWKVDEVVKLKFEGPPAMNMRRTHEVLESRTGGLVIWRSGSSMVLFRGLSYNLHCIQSYAKQNEANETISLSRKGVVNDFIQRGASRTTELSTTDYAGYSKDLSEKELKELSTLNSLLDELGPRFRDWSGRDPLPVDADLLPPVIHGYKPPLRFLPYGMRQGLRDKDMTFFRRTARTMPPHFALGRNRELQGLARAIVKLWEKSTIAKIAIKRGVQNTSNERMVEELKILTGGTLLSRNKDYIVFYRGNDFLPPGLTETLVEAQKLTTLRQDEEEQARQKASSMIDSITKSGNSLLVAGTLSETVAATSRWVIQPSTEDVEQMKKDLVFNRHASLVRYLEKKLALAKGKIKKAEKALQKVQEHLEPAELPTDLETLSDEERFLFRKIGLSMKPYLLLGRRGMYDGTIENIHLHWKYRELVKIIVKAKSFLQVKHIAISLEAESGGLLVSLDKTTKGYAIIVYRGKNYQRPQVFRPRNLLTRRQALARSIELQRREALKHHISESEEKIEKLKSELEDMKNVKDIDEETFYAKVDNASDDDDDGMEDDEGEEAYLETYASSNEDGYTKTRS